MHLSELLANSAHSIGDDCDFRVVSHLLQIGEKSLVLHELPIQYCEVVLRSELSTATGGLDLLKKNVGVKRRVQANLHAFCCRQRPIFPSRSSSVHVDLPGELTAFSVRIQVLSFPSNSCSSSFPSCQGLSHPASSILQGVAMVRQPFVQEVVASFVGLRLRVVVLPVLLVAVGFEQLDGSGVARQEL